MNSDNVNFWMLDKSPYFPIEDLERIKQVVEKIPDSSAYILQAFWFRHPVLIFIIALFFGIERLFLEDYLLGVLKIITCYGLGIWWFIDLFTAMKRAKRFNYRKFVEITGYTIRY
ncbi:MAG: TM2 domain-containing protein [Bacteroidales bacterium]|jgi:TM2 domain-containing membrane protein YozV|nr:TM2 domain-containing protein [Bacteroidales bacterium]